MGLDDHAAHPQEQRAPVLGVVDLGADVADGLAVTRPTACDAVATLVRKGLIAKEKDDKDRRAVALRLTVDGVWEADRIARWPDFLTRAVGALSPGEQETVYRALLTMIADEMAPEAYSRASNLADLATAIGFILALFLTTLE